MESVSKLSVANVNNYVPPVKYSDLSVAEVTV
jgi:hypothetical protein